MATLNIDDVTLAVWRKQAATQGLSVEEWLKGKTTAPSLPATNGEGSLLTGQEWLERLSALATRHPPTGVPMDDSRESIYEPC